MTEEKAELGMDQEGSTTRTEAPASGLIEALRRGGDGECTPAHDDTARLDWLQNRGRVKARKYGDMKDDWKWDMTSPDTLREAIDAEIEWENSPQHALSQADMPPEVSDV